MKTVSRIITLAAAGSLLAACAAPGEKAQPETEERIFGEQAEEAAAAEGEAAEARGIEGQPLAEQDAMEVHPLDDPESVLANRTIYFEYDSSQVQEQYLDLLAEHGDYLAEHPDQQVRIEGHTDERGSREYNIALGDRRAQAIKRLIMFQGVDAEQITTVSYGEERPVDSAHNEEAWAQNRRVELIYEGH